MHCFLNSKRLNYFWKIKANQLPALDESRAINLKPGKSTKMKELDSSTGAINSKAQN